MVNWHALTSSLDLSGTNVVISGGTSGIGAGIAVRCASLGASVLVMGRNQNAGEGVVAQMKSAAGDSTTAKLAFARADVASVEGMRAAAATIAAWAGSNGVDYFYQTQGGPGMDIWPLTAASATTAFNVQILSHFLVPYLLLTGAEPVLRAGAQVSTIMRPGDKGKPLDPADPDFVGIKRLEEKGTMAYLRDGAKHLLTVDLFTEEFNRRFPAVRTMHVFPGNVASGSNLSHLHWVFRALFWVLAKFGQTTAAYADVCVWQHASAEWKARGWHFFDEKGREVKVDERVLADDALREGVWARLLELSGEKPV
ncbi:hypothetical protein HWV62_34719 [Athelia sp. TMB]|nr:hypothetical protein HWV62_34719 [Athelia sp. TMB]